MTNDELSNLTLNEILNLPDHLLVEAYTLLRQKIEDNHNNYEKAFMKKNVKVMKELLKFSPTLKVSHFGPSRLAANEKMKFTIKDIEFIEFFNESSSINKEDKKLLNNRFISDVIHSLDPLFRDTFKEKMPLLLEEYLTTEIRYNHFYHFSVEEIQFIMEDRVFTFHEDRVATNKTIEVMIERENNLLFEYLITHSDYQYLFNDKESMIGYVTAGINKYNKGWSDSKNNLMLIVKLLDFDKNLSRYLTNDIDNKKNKTKISYDNFFILRENTIEFIFANFHLDKRFIKEMAFRLEDSVNTKFMLIEKMAKQPIPIIKSFIDEVKSLNNEDLLKDISNLEVFYKLKSKKTSYENPVKKLKI